MKTIITATKRISHRECDTSSQDQLSQKGLILLRAQMGTDRIDTVETDRIDMETRILQQYGDLCRDFNLHLWMLF